MSRWNLLLNILLDPVREETPHTVEDVISAIRRAEGEDRKVRAVGSAWSFSDCAVTGDILVNMSGMNQALGLLGVRPLPPATLWPTHVFAVLKPDVARSGRRLAHVEAGIRLSALNRTLERYGWTMPSMGSSTGQTIAGALATGTHGGHFSLPPIVESVRAIHMVGPGGVEHWIEPAGDASITNPGSYAAVRPALRLHYDDDWFQSAMVSVGSLGIVVGLVLECREQYYVSRTKITTSWANVKSWLREGGIVNNSAAGPTFPPGISPLMDHMGHPVRPVPEALEIFLNPHRTSLDYTRDLPQSESDAMRNCCVVSVARAEAVDGTPIAPVDFTNPPVVLDDLGIAADVQFAGYGGLERRVDQIMTAARADTGSRPMGGVNANYYTAWTVLNTYSGGTDTPQSLDRQRLFSLSGGPGPGFTLEVVLPTAGSAHIQFIDSFLRRFDQLQRSSHNLAGFLSLRFTRGTKANLGMQRFPQQTATDLVCHIEFQALKELSFALIWLFHVDVDSSGNLEGYSDDHFLTAERLIENDRGHLHWGQFNTLNRRLVEIDYTDGLQAFRRVKTQLGAGVAHATFSNDFSRRCGLEGNDEVLAVSCPSRDRCYVVGYSPAGTVFGLSLGSGTIAPAAGTEPVVSSGGASSAGRPFGGARLVGPLAAASWTNDRVDLFAVGASGHLLWATLEGGRWRSSDFSPPVGHRLTGPLGAVSVNPGTLDVLALAERGELIHFSFGASALIRVADRGTFLAGPHFAGSLSVVTAGDQRIHLFGHATDATLRHATIDGGHVTLETVSDFIPSVRFAGPVSVVSSAANRFDLFGMGDAGNLLHCRFDGVWHVENIGRSRLSATETRFDLPGAFGDAPTDAYYAYQKRVVPMQFSGPVAAAAWGGARLDVFGRAADGSIVRVSRAAGEHDWSWTRLGTVVVAPHA